MFDTVGCKRVKVMMEETKKILSAPASRAYDHDQKKGKRKDVGTERKMGYNGKREKAEKKVVGSGSRMQNELSFFL